MIMTDDDDECENFDDHSSMDLISSCKEFYIKRVRCLDEFPGKFAYSNITPSGDIIGTHAKPMGDGSASTLSEGLLQLKTDMMSLMENDILLMGKLIALSESIAEFKRQRCIPRNCQLSTSSSLISLNGDEDLITNQSYHHINRVTIADDFEDDEEDEDEILETVEIPRRDYFARQSSVLRIPIPPSRHRSRSYVDSMDDTVPGCSGEKDHAIFKRQSLPSFGAIRSSSSSTSSSDSVLHSPASDSGVSVDSTHGTIHDTQVDHDLSSMDTATKLPSRYHDSQNSFDSGILLASPMEDKLVNV